MQECEGPLVATAPQDPPRVTTGRATLTFYGYYWWEWLAGHNFAKREFSIMTELQSIIDASCLGCCQAEDCWGRCCYCVVMTEVKQWSTAESLRFPTGHVHLEMEKKLSRSLSLILHHSFSPFVPSAPDFKSCCISKNSPSKTRNELIVTKYKTSHNSLLFYVCIQSWWMCIICRWSRNNII